MLLLHLCHCSLKTFHTPVEVPLVTFPTHSNVEMMCQFIHLPSTWKHVRDMFSPVSMTSSCPRWCERGRSVGMAALLASCVVKRVTSMLPRSASCQVMAGQSSSAAADGGRHDIWRAGSCRRLTPLPHPRQTMAGNDSVSTKLHVCGSAGLSAQISRDCDITSLTL